MFRYAAGVSITKRQGIPGFDGGTPSATRSCGLYTALYIMYIVAHLNPLKGTLKQQSNELLYSTTVISTLAVDGCAVTFGTARRGLGGLWSRPVPSLLYQM